MTTNPIPNKDIKYYIDLSKNKTPTSSGSNKICYDFGEVVLLKSIGPEPQEMVATLNKIKQLGIPSYEILSQHEEQGQCFILETKVAGTPIQEYSPRLIPAQTKENIEINYEKEKEYVKQYLKRLEEISKNYEQLKQFVKNFFQLIELGIFIDPSKSNNIYYDPNQGYSFLDLQIGPPHIDTKYVFHYIFYMISWCHSSIFSEDDILTEQALLSYIVTQLRKICIELGKDPNTYLIDIENHPLIAEVRKREDYRLKFAYDSKEDYIKDNSEHLSQKA